MPNIRLIKVDAGYSLFSLVKEHCRDEAAGHSYNPAVHRLCSLMRKMGTKRAVSEVLLPSDPEIREEYTALCTHYSETIEIQAYKLTFLSRSFGSLEDIQRSKDNWYLASAIIINFKAHQRRRRWKSYLYKVIATIPMIKNHKHYGTLPLLNNYLHISKTFKCSVRISDDKVIHYNIKGTFFCQQNSTTSVCANASLCMMINNMDLSGVDLVTPESINKIIGIDHLEKKFGVDKRGLDQDEIEKVLNKYNLSYTIVDFFEKPYPIFENWIYNHIESKYPLLLVFSTKKHTDPTHVIPIFGHTLNSDTWRPEAEIAYSPSEKNRVNLIKSTAAWVDHFIIHDDNFGIYYCLPVDALKPKYIEATRRKRIPPFQAIYGIALLPKKIKTPPRVAEWASITAVDNVFSTLAEYSFDIDDWSRRLKIRIDYIMKRTRFGEPRLIATRTFLTSKKDYEKSLNKKDFQGNRFSKKDKKALLKDLPEFFWLTEITLPDLYSANKSKIIDFIFPCDAKEGRANFESWLQIRFPFGLIKQTLDKEGLLLIPMSVKSHYPLLGFNEMSMHW